MNQQFLINNTNNKEETISITVEMLRAAVIFPHR